MSMFNKRGATKRPMVRDNAGLAPAWLVRLFWALAIAFALVMLVLWHPWQAEKAVDTVTPSASTSVTPENPFDSATQNGDTPEVAQQPSELDFYQKLRTQQVTPVPDHALQTVPDDPEDTVDNTSSGNEADANVNTANSSAQQFILQINSFKTPEEADQLRANALLLGVHAEIQTQVHAGETWYRVYAGPFSKKQEAINAQKLLQTNNIDALVVAQ